VRPTINLSDLILNLS